MFLNFYKTITKLVNKNTFKLMIDYCSVQKDATVPRVSLSIDSP